MDLGENYAAQENVSRIMDLLEQEPDEPERSRLKKLLLVEEDRFGKKAERLAIAQMASERCLQRIREQRARIADMDNGDPHFPMAKRLMLNLLDSFHIVQAQIGRLKRH